MQRSELTRLPGGVTYTWIAARARNALRRVALIGVIGGVAFLIVLVTLVLVPREASRAARAAAARIEERPDSAELSSARTRALRQLTESDSIIQAARSTPPLTAAIDTTPAHLRPVRDSLLTELSALSRALTRAQNAPLASSYRALAETAPLRNDPQIQALLDSLTEVEREREAFGGGGAADPVYVNLTSRATAIGHAIQTLATAKRVELRAAVAPLLPVVARSPTRAIADTARHVGLRIEARKELTRVEKELVDIRRKNVAIDREAARVRELANVGAPPLAMLAAALVIALALGFAAAIFAELRMPRIADVREVEQVANARVLAVLKPSELTTERNRRQADVDAPPLIDIVSESYRKLYLSLAATESNVPIVTVTGDDPGIVATVAANLAAAAAYEARSTLLVDLDSATSAVASVLRVPPNPGFAGVVNDDVRWADAIVLTTIGRDRPLDVVPSGTARLATMNPYVAERIRADFARLERRYDFIVLAAPTSYVQLPTASVIPAPDVILCARTAHTAIRDLRSALESLRGAARRVHGLVLWDHDLPQLETVGAQAGRLMPTRAASGGQRPSRIAV